MPGKSKKNPELGNAALILFIFAFLCFIFAFAFSLSSGSNKIIESLSAEGGPMQKSIVTKGKNTVFLIEMKQQISKDFDWSVVYGELKDEKKEGTLLSFQTEFWQESGYDEGNWRENDSTGSVKICIRDPGTYFLNFETERKSNKTINTPLEIKVTQKKGSVIPCLIFGIISFCVAIALGLMANPQWFEE